MNFISSLEKGVLVKRYKRFLADITLDSGEAITAHCANPGSMMGVAQVGASVWVSKSPSKTRKLPYSWELVQIDDTLIAINTGNPNKIAEEAITLDAIPELSGYASVRREVKYGQNSRIDLLLEGRTQKKPCYVEVKKRAPNAPAGPRGVSGFCHQPRKKASSRAFRRDRGWRAISDAVYRAAI